MKSPIYKREIKIYNQNIWNKFTADCALFWILQIFQIKYSIWVNYKQASWIVNLFIKMGVLLPFGAYFTVIYTAWKNLIKDRKWVDTTVLKHNIMSSFFASEIEKLVPYWIGLKYYNSSFANAVSRWKITISDIDKVANQKGWFWHHLVFAKGTQYGESIFDPWVWKEIDMPIEVLRYWVKKGIFYTWGRTFKFTNPYIEKWLIIWNERFLHTWDENWIWNKDVSNFSKEEQEGMFTASILRDMKSKY